MDIKIIVATHKRCQMPPDDVYLPLQVGKAGQEPLGYMGDDTGDHISEKNATFCELTGLYWAWKNLAADYKGLVHYRRYFTHGNPWFAKRQAIYRRADFEKALAGTDIIVPDWREYYIETNASHYAHAHFGRDLGLLRQIIEARQPRFLVAFDTVMARTGAHMFNMMVMKAQRFDAYCAWLFDLLFAAENRLDISRYDSYQQRVLGFLGELLLDVWLEGTHFPYQEVNVAFMGHQNWIKKGGRFLVRKFWPKDKAW